MPLGALFYPKGTPEQPIEFDQLFIPYIYNEIYFDGIYMDVVNQLKHTKKKEDVVIVDVGANIGVVTQHLREYGTVHCIEPSKEHFEALKMNKEYNHWDNVHLYNYAIADTDGEMQMHHNADNLTCNSLIMGFKNESKDMVQTRTFKTFFKEAGITHVDFMKFDTEGGEELIFPTKDFEEATKIIDNIEVEFHLPDFTKHVNHLIKLGYQARRYNCSAIVIDFAKNR